MATRFFENQAAARRDTSWLVFLFGCAVVGMVALLYALAVLLTGHSTVDAYGREVASRLEPWQPELLLQVGLATLAVVSVGSLYKIAQLRGGGPAVAESLGGQLVPTDSVDPEARKLLNVVEEMAIASGIPAPPVYLLEGEEGINAFAAGFTPSDAAIGITRGCVQNLGRDELQGVIAHEFSHILSGDMCLNTRLMGAVHGILLIGIIGYSLLRSSMYVGGRRNSRDNSGTVILVAGFGLMVVGFLGTFFGNLIKASVSRQREFLADASAVQFTRNPDGIAGALKKIAGLDAGSILHSPAAPEASHFFFGEALRGRLNGFFATHPPLDERIRRIDPSFQSGRRGAPRPAAPQHSGGAGFAAGVEASSLASGLSAARSVSALDQLGAPTPAHLEYAASLVGGLPGSVVSASHEPHGARALVYALLIDVDEEARRHQLRQLAQFGEAGIGEETLRLLGKVEQLDSRARLPVVDMALPALRRLSPRQYEAFKKNVQVLVEADHRIDLFEWTLQRILLTHLRPHFEREPIASRGRHSLPLGRLSAECSLVLSVLAQLGSPGDAAEREAFGRGAAQLGEISLQLLPEGRRTLAALDPALSRLAQADARAAQHLVHACAACITADGVVSEAQGEVMRAIADSLGAPMPPLLPGQKLV